jgi:serine/threonine protein kinase/tetratricopeptide (TPR) repeat protein
VTDHDRPTTPAQAGRDPGSLEPADLQPGDRIGPYRVRQRLGEGGMGVVWLAEQDEPIRRRVAIKIIKWGMDTRQVVARFASERQVLARLDHPNIARVFDAGSTEHGRPSFVMEYVPGIAITEYCDKHRLTVIQRLELFLQVCEGVQHAHRNAIIHRDLKPQNVLVSVLEGRPVPKIIDFGVAKATDRSLEEGTVFTEHGQLIGTPEYMSPEQAEMSSLDVDTRTDLYSLGVLLYELLTGLLPFDSRQLRQAGIDEIRRRIREDEPPLPSTRLGRDQPQTESIARAHATSVGRLVSELRGDLDWITMKALEKDRTRRYGTATELADDLRRHLRNEPVLASPPSTLYRVRKFVRRHAVGVAFAAVVFALVTTLAVTMTVQADRLARERDRTAAEAEKARQVSEFLVQLFSVSDPGESRGNTVTAREILDAGADRVRLDLADQPAVQATMLRTMGRVYTALSLFGAARPLLEEAVALGERDPAVDQLELAAALYELVKLNLWLGQAEEALPLAEQSLAIRERQLGPDHLDVAASLTAVGATHQHLDRLDASAEAHERALAIREAALGPDAEEVAVSVHNLAIVRYFQGDLERAAQLYQRSADIELRHVGRLNHGYATSLHTLAIVRQDQGRLEEALELERESLEIREEVLGPDHHHTALSLATLGNVLTLMGRPEEGEPHLRRAWRIATATVGATSEDGLWVRDLLADCLRAQGRDDEAAALFTE